MSRSQGATVSYRVQATVTRNGSTWQVYKDDNRRFSASGLTQTDAVNWAIARAKRDRGTLTVFKRDGTVRYQRHYHHR